MFHNLEVLLPREKTTGPIQVIEFLGILIDSIRLQVCLPRDKIIVEKSIVDYSRVLLLNVTSQLLMKAN